jgi:gliding motility-associated-like protein
MIKGCILFLLPVILCSLEAIAQKPIILSVDKTSGAQGDHVTIKGSDFGTDPANLKVSFGSVSGQIKKTTNQLLEVVTPSGTTYDHISVTNITNGLTGYSPLQYFLNFNGEDAVTPSSFSDPKDDLQATSGLYDLCLCDFNNDGKLDVATASDNSNSIAILRNTGTAGNLSLVVANTLINVKSLHVACGDITGDGRPDIALSEGLGGDRIVIMRATGPFTFAIPQTIKLTGRKVKRVAIADLDLNGKPELIVTDQGSETITILPNQSTVSSISFGTPVTFDIPGASSTDALEIKDLNGNGLPEILTSQFLTENSNIFICENKSSPGTFSFSDITTLSVTNTIVNIRVGDLDGDQKPDIAATRLLGSDIVSFRNESSSSAIAFSPAQSTATNIRPWGLDFGDLDGDGKADIAVASIEHKSITVLLNQSAPGSINFKPMITLPTTFINRHTKIGDMDGDGKPDIAFTSIDDNKSGDLASRVSIVRNKSCFTPEITPGGPLEICSGFPLQLVSNTGGGVTYQWERSGTPVLSGPDNFFDVTVSGDYQVTALSEGGACSKESSTVSVTVSTPGSGISPADPGATSNGPICTDEILNLSVNDMGATAYRWSGPNGFTAIGRNPSVPEFTLAKSGIYVVELIAGTCVAATDSVVVQGIDKPDFSIIFSGTSLICEGSSKTLTVSPVVTSGFTYQWFEQSQGELAGETNPTLLTTAGGDYYVEVASVHPGCSPESTEKINLKAVDLPIAAFTPSVNEGCEGQVITFANQSTVDPQATPAYAWSFGDGTTSTEISPEYSFDTPSTFQVKLSVSYEDGACPDEETKPVTITNAPVLLFTAPDNNFKLCVGDTLRLGVTGDTFSNYEWSTGATTPTILIEEPIAYSVTVTTSGGCILTALQKIDPIAAPTVSISADKTTIQVDEEILLTATGGLASYLWRPGLALSDSTIANPLASPLQDITYTVSGKDVNGCYGEASIDIKVIGASVFSLIKPSVFFSPNNDEHHPYWTIREIESFPGCEVIVYNDKGSKVFEAKPYTNNWDGTFKGSKLPGGVYYYAIRCDGEAKVKTGSITLLK